MKFNDCPLKNELKEGLLQYERDTNISPLSLIENLLEEFLYKKGYLVVGGGEENVPFPSELNKPPIEFTNLKKSGNLEIRKTVDGNRYSFAYCTYDEAKILVEFLKSKNWDVKYSTKHSLFKGKEHIAFLFNEMEKEGFL